jgi:hypothetical protein
MIELIQGSVPIQVRVLISSYPSGLKLLNALFYKSLS